MAAAAASEMKTSVSSQQLDSYINVSSKVTCPTAVEQTYDEWATTYEDDSAELLGFTSPQECAKTAAMFAKDGDAFLDVGCGTGLISAHLRDLHHLKFTTRMGCDLSMKMLELAEKRGLYDTIMKLDMSQLPWSLPPDAYDIVCCNGVLIYVEEVNCLDEFVRVTKKGGHMCLMFRHDGYPTYQAKVEQLTKDGKWELVYKSESRNNFAGAESQDAAKVMYNIWTFKKL